MAILSGNTSLLQGAGGTPQGATGTPQQTSGSGAIYQPAGSGLTVQPLGVAPAYNQSLTSGAANTALVDTGAATQDPAAAAAAAKAAADAAQAAALRGQVSGLINNIKDIFNSRYGQVDQSAGEQTGKLNERFGTESSDLARQIADELSQSGGAFAGRGTRDSSDYGNAVDQINQAGQSQIGALGNELHDNIAKIAQWVQTQKTGFGAQKAGYDAVLSHLAEETDPNNLMALRNTLDSKIADLQGGAADNNTEAQNISALDSIAPTSARAQQLQTTLKQIMGGNADANTKTSLANKLIASANLDPADQQKLEQAFTADLSTPQQPA